VLLKGEQLAAHLERELRAVYVVWGDEPLLVIEAADAIRAAARRKGFDEREVLTAISGFDWVALHHAGADRSLFGGRKLIDLRIPTGKPGREGSAAIQDYCERAASNSNDSEVVLLVTLPGLDWSEEKAAWLKALSDAGIAVKLFVPTLAELPAWIAGRLRRQEQRADAEALRFIAERVEGNLLAAHQEILKLGLLYPPGDLTLAEVEEAVLKVARYDLDGLREALLSGDVTRLTRTLEGLQQEGEAPPLVLWAMTEEVRALAQVKGGIAEGGSLDALLKEARVFGARQGPFKRALQRIDLRRVQRALAHAASIDRMIKGIGVGNVWDEFLRLGLKLADGAGRD
jgi:DNA polymerase-3 subunit delta